MKTLASACSSLVVALAALVLVVGCSKKEQKPAPVAESAKSAAPVVDKAVRTERPKPQLEPITVDEVKESVPAPAGARVLKELTKAPQGEIVQGTYCFDNTEVKGAADKVKETLTAAGWQNVTVRENPAHKDRAGITGVRQPYIVFGSAQRGPWQDCVADKGQTYVALNVRKVPQMQMPVGGPLGGATGGAPLLQPGMPRPMIPPGFVPGPGGAAPGGAPAPGVAAPGGAQ